MAEIVKNNQIPVAKRVTLPQAKKMIDINFDDLNLSNREKIFVIVYASQGFKDIQAAYLAAWKRPKTVNILGNRSNQVFHRERVQKAIERIVTKFLSPYINKIEYNLYKTLYIRAFYKISDFYHPNGEIKELNEIPEELLLVIDGIKKRFYGKDAQKEIVEYQLSNRSEALRTIKELVDKLKESPKEEAEQHYQQLREMIFNKDYNSLSEKNIFEIEKARIEGA